MATIPDGFDLVPLSADRLRDVLDLDLWAFPAPESVEDLLALPSPLTWERAFALTEVGRPEQLVAVHASYPFGSCPVPGGRVAAAGLTWVGVHPGWRRRGLLRAMIHSHFEDCRRLGEPVSVLTASEPAIYGRFGYGLASVRVHLTLRRGAALRPVTGSERVSVRYETLDAGRHGDLVGRLHAAVERPGWITRETAELGAAVLGDPPVFRRGREAMRILIAERDDSEVGYALFRRASKFSDAGPEGTVSVEEVVAGDPATAHALWSRLLDLDLTHEVTSGMLAPDDALLGLLVDVRAARPAVKDNVWVRILDVPAALSARQFQAPVDVVLEVADDLVPGTAGRWHVRADAFSPATVERTDAPADLALGIRELGAAYLGGASLAALAAAGLVQERRPGSLLPAAAAFGWPVAPGSSWIF